MTTRIMLCAPELLAEVFSLPPNTKITGASWQARDGGAYIAIEVTGELAAGDTPILAVFERQACGHGEFKEWM